MKNKKNIPIYQKKNVRISGKKELVVVSDHAIVRYMQRVMNIDIYAIRDNIFTNQALSYMDKFGGKGTYPANDKFSVVMQDNVVVSIITPNTKDKDELE
jgi:hypothetical protein